MEFDNSSGLLMKIVRSLSTSGCKDDRDDEKVRLENDYKECDKRLDNMISDHLTDLTSTIQTFSQLSSRITTSQEKVRAVKENLMSCKNLLHCKRDELKRLWVEGIKFKNLAELMDEVEKIKGVNEKLKRALEARDYVEAAILVMSSLAVLGVLKGEKGDLESVKGLDEFRVSLSTRREEMVVRILQELHNIIYIRSTSTIIRNFQRQGSQNRTRPDLKSNTSLETSAEADEEQMTRMILEADIKSLDKSPPPNTPFSDPVVFISSLVISLNILKRLPESIVHIRQQISPAITTIIIAATKQVADTSSSFDDDLRQLQQPQLLLDLLELIFTQLRVVSHTHQIVIANLIRIKASSKSLSDLQLYYIIDLWSKAQKILQKFLSYYLETDESSFDSINQSQATNLDLTSFFSKKRPMARGKNDLFRFNQSEQAIDADNPMFEISDLMCMKRTMVCKPSSDNIIPIYNTLYRFLNQVSSTTGYNTSKLALHGYIYTFIEGPFMMRLQHSMDAILHSSLKSLEPKKVLTDPHTQKAFKLPRPLFTTTTSVATFIDHVCQLTSHLPDYSPKLMNLLCKSLQNYLSSLQNLYRDFSDMDNRKVTSAEWVDNTDINCLIRSLPNWMELKKVEESSISEADLRRMRSKESTIFSDNLRGAEVLFTNILSAHDTLKQLAHLCESSLWFSERIDDFCGNLENGNTTLKFLLSTSIKPHLISNRQHGDQAIAMTSSRKLHVSNDTLRTLKSLAKNFEELSDSCILLLYIEVRMHCLYHLLKLSDNEFYCLIDRLEPDDHVTRLCKDLSNMQAVLVHSLQEGRFKYIFQGLGHLISTTLMAAAAKIKRINDTGVKKMCRNVATVQQCLTTFLNVREPDLDHARQFYELLYLSPDEVMEACFNSGSQFSEKEYKMLLQLNHRSHTEVSTEDDLNRRLKKLASILGDSSA